MGTGVVGSVSVFFGLRARRRRRRCCGGRRRLAALGRAGGADEAAGERRPDDGLLGKPKRVGALPRSTTVLMKSPQIEAGKVPPPP